MSDCFSEEKYDLLTFESELERMKKDMEAKLRVEMEAKMRMDVLRMEEDMKAKLRSEMEAKMRMDVLRMEEERKAQEERRQLEKQKKEMRDELVAYYQKQVCSASYPADYRGRWNRQLEFIEKNNILTYTGVELNIERVSGHSIRPCLELYMTDTCFGIHLAFNETQDENRPFYWFDSELTQRDLAILKNLKYTPGITHPITRTTFYTNIGSSPLPQLKYIYGRHFGAHNIEEEVNHTFSVDAANFETIVRLIPGSYRNGPWRPLAGFFGPYLNEETLEITTIVPVLE